MKDLKWTIEDSESATLEGWNLYHSEGSIDGDRQVQRNDDQGLLEDDEQAWAIVNKGDKPHHIKAKDILRKENISEYNRIIRFK